MRGSHFSNACLTQVLFRTILNTVESSRKINRTNLDNSKSWDRWIILITDSIITYIALGLVCFSWNTNFRQDPYSQENIFL